MPHVFLAERHGPVVISIRTKKRTEQAAPLRRGVEAIRVVEHVSRLVAHVHHDLPFVFQAVDRALEGPQLGIGEVKGDAEHRLLIRAPPLVGEIADRPELLEAPAIQLAVELVDIFFDWRSFDPQPELTDLLAQDPADLRVEGFEFDH